MKLFNLDSPLMQALSKMADLMWLNVLTLICCLPIVTVGASLTAMNYMALKIARNEECYITRGFFKSFKENFKQATVIWLILLTLIIILISDLWIVGGSEQTDFGVILWGIIAAVTVVTGAVMIYVFPVLAKFENTVFKTFKNALLMSLVQFPKTVVMMLAYAAPPILFFLVPQIMPLCLMFGLALPAWVSAKLYNKLFKRLEDKVMAENPPDPEDGDAREDERIFKDELDPALSGNDTMH